MDDQPGGPDLPSGPAGHWLGIVDKAHDLVAGRIDARKKQHVEDVLHQLEADLAPLIGPLAQRVIDNPEASDELKGLMREAGAPEHQFGSLVVGFAIGATIAPALGAAFAPEIQGIENVAWGKNPTRPLSPEIAAAAVLKGVLTEAEGADRARVSGTDAGQFGVMVEAAGQSIGLAEALLLFRRGQITEAHLREIEQYSNLNPRFYDDILKLRFGPPPAGEVITGALKGHLDDATAQRLLGEAGIDPANYTWMHQTAGRPPGIQEMLHLWNRGVATEADVDAAVRQSDINTDYLRLVKELRHYYPPPRSIVPMLRTGAITEAQARQLLTYYGVGEPWASAFIAEAHHSSSTNVKELSQAQVVRMYSNRLIGRAAAHAKLVALKYTDDDANLLLDFADDARTERVLNATINKVGTLYVAHKLALNDATHALSSAGVPPAAQHDLFALWDIQRDANVHLPTVAGIVGAYRRGQIGAHTCKVRLLELGVQQSDIGIFVADGFPPSKPADAQAAADAVANA